MWRSGINPPAGGHNILMSGLPTNWKAPADTCLRLRQSAG
jgi:hypothetical protein